VPVGETAAGRNETAVRHRALRIVRATVARHTGVVTFTETSRYGGASAAAWDRLHPRLTRHAAWLQYAGEASNAVRGHRRGRIVRTTPVTTDKPT
jgi:hypothetical protein